MLALGWSCHFLCRCQFVVAQYNIHPHTHTHTHTHTHPTHTHTHTQHTHAHTQIKAIWSVLLRNFDFEMIDPVPEADYESMVIAPKPCRVRYVRRKLTV